MKGNIFYAQSGGVTPVINATAFGLIEQFFKNKKYFGKFQMMILFIASLLLSLVRT
mgnify:CR=1 FL=1